MQTLLVLRQILLISNTLTTSLEAGQVLEKSKLKLGLCLGWAWQKPLLPAGKALGSFKFVCKLWSASLDGRPPLCYGKWKSQQNDVGCSILLWFAVKLKWAEIWVSLQTGMSKNTAYIFGGQLTQLAHVRISGARPPISMNWIKDN